MLYLVYRLCLIGLPKLGQACQNFVEPLMLIVIILIGMLILFGALGMHISNNLGSTIVGGLMKGAGRLIGFIGTQIFTFVRWLFTKLVPNIYNGSKRFFADAGASAVQSRILAVLTSIIVVAVII